MKWYSFLIAMGIIANSADAGLIVCSPPGLPQVEQGFLIDDFGTLNTSVGVWMPHSLPHDEHDFCIEDFVIINEKPTRVIYTPDDWPIDEPRAFGFWGIDIDTWETEPLGHDEYLENLMLHWQFMENPRHIDWLRLGRNYTFGP